MALNDILMHFKTTFGTWKERYLNFSSNQNNDNRVIVADKDGIPSDLPAGNPGEFLSYDATFQPLPIGTNRVWSIIVTDIDDNLEDEDLYDIQTKYLEPYYSTENLVLKIGDTFNCHGMINSIGTVESISWSLNRNRYILLQSTGGGWFGLKNCTEDNPTTTKKIITGTGADLYNLKKALLVYVSSGTGYFVVLSFEKAEWFKCFDVPAIESGKSEITITLPEEGIPMPGYYSIYVQINVSERDIDPPGSAGTAAAQSLSISDSDYTDSAITVDVSTAGDGGGLQEVNLFNSSLQGSAIVQIRGNAVENRKVKLNVLLPNGQMKSVNGGYVHMTHLGYKLGKQYKS